MFVENIYKVGCLESSGVPVLYIGRTVLKVKPTRQYIQGDQNVSVHLMITVQKVTSNVQSVPRLTTWLNLTA
jgi:hypothetical protein